MRKKGWVVARVTYLHDKQKEQSLLFPLLNVSATPNGRSYFILLFGKCCNWFITDNHRGCSRRWTWPRLLIHFITHTWRWPQSGDSPERKLFLVGVVGFGSRISKTHTYCCCVFQWGYTVRRCWGFTPTHTNTHLTHTPPTSSSHHPSLCWLSSLQSCQADSSKLHGKWVLLALQLCGADFISAIWKWAWRVQSGRVQHIPLSVREWALTTSLIHQAGMRTHTHRNMHTHTHKNTLGNTQEETVFLHIGKTLGTW